MSEITPDLPYMPRQLTVSELKKLDIYLYESPKLRRRVTLVGPIALALGLQFEFDPDVLAYIERPRMLSVDGTDIDLSFWSRTRKGIEQFSLITLSPEGSTAELLARNRRRDALVTAAQRAHLSLQFVPLAQFIQAKTISPNRLRLLPFVQTASDVPQADVLGERILALFSTQARMGFAQIERSLSDFDARDTRAVACQLVHRGQLQVDWQARLHSQSVLEKRGAA